MKEIELETPELFGRPSHVVRFWIRPARKKILFSVRLPVQDGESVEDLLCENYADRGYNPGQSIGGFCFSKTTSIILDAMDAIDESQNRDFGVLSCTPICF